MIQLDAWASAESSPFSLGNNSRLQGGSNNNGGGGGGSGGGGGGGGGGKKLGRVDDVRGPECMCLSIPYFSSASRKHIKKYDGELILFYQYRQKLQIDDSEIGSSGFWFLFVAREGRKGGRQSVRYHWTLD